MPNSAEALAGKLRIDDLEPQGRRVLLRADLNLPVQDGVVTDMTRVIAMLPTLRALLGAGAVVVVMSHRGRPNGETPEEFSMAPVAEAMRLVLGHEVILLEDCIGGKVETAIQALVPGNVALLGNLRCHPGETSNDAEFARELASLADLYVDDAFGAVHRAHASIIGVPPLVEAAAAGYLLELEVQMLSRCMDEPAKPFVLVAGGAKVSDKLDALANLMPLVDQLIIGGAMANTVLTYQGIDMGNSRIEDDAIELAAVLLERAEKNGVEVLLPNDFVVAADLGDAASARVVRQIPATTMVFDIGPESIERFASAIADAQTVLWNGPMGVFEIDELAGGTQGIGSAIADVAGRGGISIVGGGDTAAAVSAAGLSSSMTHVSTGGGASLDLLSGSVLPGIVALTDR
ncbi:MAG TPA: phosphoglycerate kinase [Acidobacteriota bacterium]|nr:phosphoglycerate kinase [Acidobacteriota bacterium]HJO30147.1 phosphoglycerate kinase [Acidobacteriota bacterium]